MGPCFHQRRRARVLPWLAAVTVLTALFSVAAMQAASAGAQPCPSCPDKYPPPSSGSQGGGGSGYGTGGSAAPALPLISLAPISVSNGVASVTGTVNAKVAAAASAAAKIRVTVNGTAIGISAGGTFSATTNVAAHGGIVVRAGDVSTGITYAISIPDSAVPSNGVAADALAQLEADGVTLMLPPDGFTVVDGVEIRATVRAAGITGIARLTLNGADLLAKLRVSSSSSSGSASSSSAGSAKPGTVKPGSGSAAPKHSASAAVSGQAKKVRVTVTATSGAKQTTIVPVRRVRSVIRIGKQVSISAFGARGIRVSAVRFDTHAARTGTLGVSVTVRDRRQYLVRDAVVILQPAANRVTLGSSTVRMSNRLGQASFRVHVGSGALGHRLYLRIVAQTPLSTTHVMASTRLTSGAG